MPSKSFEIKHLIVGPLLTNCYILISKGEALVIDPGGGLKKILETLAKNKAKLNYIILTHHHWDHTLGALKLKKETGAKILTNLKEGDKIKVGDNVLKVVHTPGHTKESICLLGENFIFTGDTLFEDAHGRTDLPGGSQKEMENSLEKLKKILKPGTKIFPGHGPIFAK